MELSTDDVDRLLEAHGRGGVKAVAEAALAIVLARASGQVKDDVGLISLYLLKTQGDVPPTCDAEHALARLQAIAQQAEEHRERAAVMEWGGAAIISKAREDVEFSVEVARLSRHRAETAETGAAALRAKVEQVTGELAALRDMYGAAADQRAEFQAKVAELEKSLERYQNPRCQREECVRERARVDSLESQIVAEREYRDERIREVQVPLRTEVERLKADVERQYKALEACQAQLDDRGLLERRAESAESAESRLAAVREIVLKTRKAPRGAEETADAYDRGFGDGWVARGAKMRAEVDALEGDTPNPSMPSNGSDTMSTVQQHEDLQRITGAKPEETKHDIYACRVENCPECARVIASEIKEKGPAVVAVGFASAAGLPVRIVPRYPCSPTCTHDDAANPGHPERVKERSEAVKVLSETILPGPDVIDGGPGSRGPVRRVAESARRSADAYAEGAEAMRAACLEASLASVKRSLGVVAGDPALADLEAAIRRATPGGSSEQALEAAKDEGLEEAVIIIQNMPPETRTISGMVSAIRALKRRSQHTLSAPMLERLSLLEQVLALASSTQSDGWHLTVCRNERRGMPGTCVEICAALRATERSGS